MFYVHMPIGRVNFKVGVLSRDSVPYMIKIVLTNVPFKCGIVASNVDRLLYCPG